MTKPTDEEFRTAAVRMYYDEGKVEIDPGTSVSSADGGAYVQAQVWVSTDDVTDEDRQRARVYREPDDRCLQESPEKKRAWLADAQRRVPIGTRVRVVRSDLDDYIGATGEVVEHEVGDIGEWPVVSVRFDKTTRGATRDAFYCDGSDDDEIEVIEMSDPGDKIDQHRDEAINKLVSAVNDAGGLETITDERSGGETWLVLKGDTDLTRSGVVDAYLAACKAVGEVPLIDGKRRTPIVAVSVTVDRTVGDEISDEQNEEEVGYINDLFAKMPEDIEVRVLDKDGVYLYSAHKEV